MTLTPNFLPVGSIVEYNGMINDIVGIIPPKPDKSKRFNNVWVVELSIGVICPLSDISPIPLTPEILTEWCGFVDMNDSMCFKFQMDADIAFRIYLANDRDGNEVWACNNCDILQKDSSDDFHQVCLSTCPDFLHELQLIFLGFKTVLPITIK